MLNLFPIQFLALLAYAILRVFAGLILLALGIRHLKGRSLFAEQFSAAGFPFGWFFAWYVGFFEILIGTLFVLGLATQIAALLSILLSLKFLYLRGKMATMLIPERIFWVILIGVSLSLFITGAGAFAFDLPI